MPAKEKASLHPKLLPIKGTRPAAKARAQRKRGKGPMPRTAVRTVPMRRRTSLLLSIVETLSSESSSESGWSKLTPILDRFCPKNRPRIESESVSESVPTDRFDFPVRVNVPPKDFTIIGDRMLNGKVAGSTTQRQSISGYSSSGHQLSVSPLLTAVTIRGPTSAILFKVS
jgi:hypothetical protein